MGSAPAHSAAFLTAEEVADQLRVSTMTVYRLIERRELPAVRVGRQVRVAATDLDEFLAANRTSPEHDMGPGFVVRVQDGGAGGGHS